MIKSWKDGEIVWLEVEGEFLADEIAEESKKWFETKKDEYIGYLVDVRKMTKQSAFEQKKAEERARKEGTGKPRAVLGNDIAMATVVNIYTRFTGAEGIKYFTDEQSAAAWLRSKKI
jgi:hypothetical protein